MLIIDFYAGERNDESIVTHATKELHGHSSRAIWLSWSPHKDGILASASYDKSVIVWDTNTGRIVLCIFFIILY